MTPFEAIGVIVMATAIGGFVGYAVRLFVEGIEDERDAAVRARDELRRLR